MKCPSCGYENREGAPYCDICQTSFSGPRENLSVPASQFVSEPFPRPIVQPTSQTREVIPPPPHRYQQAQSTDDQPEELNWFQRHLNWTWMLADIPLLIIGLIWYYILYIQVGQTSREQFIHIASISLIIFIILNWVVTFGVGAWVLKRKARSYAWLLVLFLRGLGVIIFLCIENHRNNPTLLKYNPSDAGLRPGTKYSY